VTLEGPRILDKGFAGGVITNSAEPPPSGSASATGGISKLSDNVFANRSYYDLSGYTQNDLTAFFAGVEIQEEFSPHGTMPGFIVDMITTHRLSGTDIINAHFTDPASTLDLPGFHLSTFDMSQVIYARTRTFNTSQEWGQISEYGRTMWGTCSAATSEKIYLTRIIYTAIPFLPEGTITIPPCNYVTTIIVGKEPDLTFIMRQRRSYEEATAV
jgi:hypothetical protein